MSVFADIRFPKVVYEVDSKINGHIQIVEAGRTKRIIVDKITQSVNWDSPVTQSRVWGRLVEVLKANEPHAKNILILGMAGGTMQQLISRSYKDVNILSIELDPVMIDLAKKFFDLDSIPNHTVINGDACRFIVEPETWGYRTGAFEAVIVDICVGSSYPDLGKSGNFISSVRNMAMPGGLVIFNRIYHTQELQEEANTFIDNLDNFLHDVKSLIIAGTTNSDNVIIYGRA